MAILSKSGIRMKLLWIIDKTILRNLKDFGKDAVVERLGSSLIYSPITITTTRLER
jgi:hypothetical protein